MGAVKEGVSSLNDQRYEAFKVDPKEMSHVKPAMAYVYDNYESWILQANLCDHTRKHAHSQQTTTLLHGDFRGDNIFFQPGSKGKIKVVDYQLIREGLGGE